MHLTASFRKVDSVVVVYLKGKILFGNEVETISRQVFALAASSRNVVLELSNLTDMCSGDLGSLWLQYMQAQASGWHIRISGVPSHIQQLIEGARIESVFEIHPTEEEAIAAFQAGNSALVADSSPAA
ncbi:MAG TPA: STAS domain-containing protein [Terriglobales bacterium]|nr:STAS domain-containing protein [Terriglobales bacterium]